MYKENQEIQLYIQMGNMMSKEHAWEWVWMTNHTHTNTHEAWRSVSPYKIWEHSCQLVLRPHKNILFFFSQKLMHIAMWNHFFLCSSMQSAHSGAFYHEKVLELLAKKLFQTIRKNNFCKVFECFSFQKGVANSSMSNISEINMIFFGSATNLSAELTVLTLQIAGRQTSMSP